MAIPSSSQKPRILMLHGGGVSGMIFTIQTRKITHRLREHFDFIFVDAPWVSPPGPGVLPVFAEAGPFYRWARYHENENPAKLHERLRETLSEPGGEWVGVLGFSQGGRLATGLCWEQEHGAKGLDMLISGLKFKFAVLIGAAWPLLLPTQDTLASPQRENSVWEEKYEASIAVPSVHLIGKQDSIGHMSRLTYQCYEAGSKKLLEPDIGHHMPLDEEDNAELCDAILEAYKQAGGVIE